MLHTYRTSVFAKNIREFRYHIMMHEIQEFSQIAKFSEFPGFVFSTIWAVTSVIIHIYYLIIFIFCGNCIDELKLFCRAILAIFFCFSHSTWAHVSRGVTHNGVFRNRVENIHTPKAAASMLFREKSVGFCTELLVICEKSVWHERDRLLLLSHVVAQ